MKIQFISKTMIPKSLQMIDHVNTIISTYLGQGLRLTLRQLYYQLVTRNIIPNVEKSYKNLSSLVSDGRLAGLIDWDAIEDRVRRPNIPPEWKNLEDIVNSALYSYRLPRWAGQLNYVELWVEKDALAGVLEPLGQKYHVPIMVNRGYSSQSAMYESSLRFINHDRKSGQKGFVLYLGDLDPSGEDMVRDIQSRMNIFGASVKVIKVALNMEQVQKYNPPPNPAKMSDPRAKDFVEKFGGSSWEVDAIEPKELQKIISEHIEGFIDQSIMDKILEAENKDKAMLQDAVKSIMRR